MPVFLHYVADNTSFLIINYHFPRYAKNKFIFWRSNKYEVLKQALLSYQRLSKSTVIFIDVIFQVVVLHSKPLF